MSTVDSGYYESLRRGVEQEYAAGMAGNTYSQTLSRNRGNRDLNLMQSIVQAVSARVHLQLRPAWLRWWRRQVGGDATLDVQLPRLTSNATTRQPKPI